MCHYNNGEILVFKRWELYFTQ